MCASALDRGVDRKPSGGLLILRHPPARFHSTCFFGDGYFGVTRGVP